MGIRRWAMAALGFAGCSPSALTLDDAKSPLLRISGTSAPDGVVGLTVQLQMESRGDCTPLDDVTASVNGVPMGNVNLGGPEATQRDPTGCQSFASWNAGGKLSNTPDGAGTVIVRDDSATYTLDLPTLLVDRAPTLAPHGAIRVGSTVQVLWPVPNDIVEIDSLSVTDATGRSARSQASPVATVATHFAVTLPLQFAPGPAVIILSTTHIVKTGNCPVDQCQATLKRFDDRLAFTVGP